MSEPKLKVVKISKSGYEALSEKETNTMYFVYDGSEVSLFFGEKNISGEVPMDNIYNKSETYSKAEVDLLIAEGGDEDLASLIEDIEDGTTIVEKALKDSLGNTIKSTYANKLDLVYSSSNNRIAITLKSYDGTSLDADLIDLPKATTTSDGLMSKEDKAYVDGLPSALSSKENKSEKGVANGYASLDGSAKIHTSQLPDSILGQLEYKGTFDPSSGYPVSPEKGWFYIAIANAAISGADYKVGDWAVYNGSSWDKVDNTDAVASVNGKLGAVVLYGTEIQVGNGDTWTVEQRIANIYAGLDDRNALAEVTWQELKDKRDASLLMPGQQYRITDYITTTVQSNTQSAGHQFDLIVTADSVNKLNENARACLHDGDTYFANSKLEAWKLKYCLDNDTSRFAWADEVNGKGVIYRMIDEFNNDVPYDFKNIQYQTRPGFTLNQWGSNYAFARDAGLDMIIADVQYYGYVGSGTPGGWSSNTCWLRDNLATTSSVIYNVSGAVQSPSGTILVVTNENYDVYTFSKTRTTPEDFDVSLNGLLYRCYGNTIRPYVTTQAQVLNRIIFVGIECHSNTFGNNCRSNAFGAYCSRNTFGTNCESNTFGDYCQSNTFGQDCSKNTFGDSCQSNTFGNYCQSNTFGNSYQYNAFGTNCGVNTFGNGCSKNTFGNECRTNTFGNTCSSNTFGNECSNNTFGSNCYYNTFGNSCNRNIFGSNCSSNTFGTSCSDNTFGNSCYSNTFGNECQYLQISDVSATHKKYIHVENGTKGASSANKFDLYDPAILNKNYQVTFKKSASGKYLMLWATDTGTLTGKVKATATTPTWEDIEENNALGDIDSALDAILGV